MCQPALRLWYLAERIPKSLVPSVFGIPLVSREAVLTPQRGLRRAQTGSLAGLGVSSVAPPGPVSVPVSVHVPACLGLSCIELASTALPCLASPGVPHVCAAMWVLGCVDKRQVPQSTYKPTQRSTTELPVPIKAGMLSSLRPAVWPVFSPLTEPVQNKWFRSWTYWVAQPVNILSPLACPGAASQRQ